MAAVVLAVARLGGTGYVPLALDLVTPLEFALPVLAFGVGYRALLEDARRGKLDMLRTYPVSRPTLVVGVFLGRALPVLLAVLVPLLVGGLVVAVTGGTRSAVLATHAGADSPLLFLRFGVLTAAFALVVLAIASAVSAASRSTREALALTGMVLLALVVGLDVGLVAGLAGGLVPEGALVWLLAASPGSAYRGLVLQTVVSPVATGATRAAHPLANLAGLAAWGLGGLGIAIRTVWPR